MESKGLSLSGWLKRSDHFMSPQLLGSQIAEMEPFDQQVPLLKLDLAGSVEQLLLQMLSFTASLAKQASALRPSNSGTRRRTPDNECYDCPEKKGPDYFAYHHSFATGWGVRPRHPC